MSHAVQDTTVWDTKRKGNAIIIAFHNFFKQNIGAIDTFICCTNEYWFIFLGVTADMDTTNSVSANQASYTLMISWRGQLYHSSKERKLDFHKGNHYLSYLLTRLLILNFNMSSHLLQLIYLKHKWNAFPVFHFTHNIVLLSIIRTKLSTKIVEIKNYRAFTCVYNLWIQSQLCKF